MSDGPVDEVQAMFRLHQWGTAMTQGRTADVWPARHRVIGAAVALKVFRVPAHGEITGVARRFEHEVQAMARLTNENLVRILDAGVTPSGYGAIVMEWCDYTLERFMTEQIGDHEPELMSSVEASEMIDQLALGLEAAREAGVLAHGDITPRNVLYGGGVWKIGDFGTASWSDANGVTDRTSMFTPTWAAPELPERPQPQSDVYALAKLFVWVTTGESDDDQIERAHRRVRRVIEQGLSADPAARQATPRDFADELDGAVGGVRAHSFRRFYLVLCAAMVLLSTWAVIWQLPLFRAPTGDGRYFRYNSSELASAFPPSGWNHAMVTMIRLAGPLVPVFGIFPLWDAWLRTKRSIATIGLLLVEVAGLLTLLAWSLSHPAGIALQPGARFYNLALLVLVELALALLLPSAVRYRRILDEHDERPFRRIAALLHD